MVDAQTITILIVAAVAIFTLLSSRYTVKKRTDSNGYPVYRAGSDLALSRLKRDLEACRFDNAVLLDENSALESEIATLKAHVDHLKRKLASAL